MPHTTRRRPLRADAQRNHDRIVSAARDVFARDGAGAALKEIARQAGTGSATLHRLFPSRRALLEAVFHDRVEELCALAARRAEESGPGPALLAWLGDLNAYARTSRGLAASLLHDGQDADLLEQNEGCQAMITDAAGRLLRRAQQAGAVRPEIRAEDLLALVNAISLATEQHDDDAQANRLLDIAIKGL
ncbi:TetR/AcrR family transcriptional regulator [Nonomuraea gerenzanensis]|uniref:Transcriptional regulator, TetR family n=1 Tax=Nonomuraea gerenzanensis TaxID=93944 RepID=A0A1M4EBS6_9ACTN|nr:TetR/AcrR family transcriptional regulator [Nonomuraea gerenzanensis]UBU18364.1 TetR/AcrR family transcriptional regulator [Nonomuraea gerenzanensis]SBO96192.1 Transcriptional regulator, TetR family [Nonomuraea gerenzanensis]